MSVKRLNIPVSSLHPFNRDFFGSEEVVSYIGSGVIGGKASGLAFAKDIIASRFTGGRFRNIAITIPRLVVIATDVFDRFLQRNGLANLDFAELSDTYVAHLFQRAEFPAEEVGNLRALIETVRTPLAIRSSSLLEDAMYEPFAGVYETKMIPNNQPDADTRFRRLLEAIKFVYASVYFRGARDYVAAVGRSVRDEKMAVIIQEVIGRRHGNRFYPDLSGVARSHNFYPMGWAKPEQGVVDLALGLGKTIVDGGTAWSYSPAYPKVNPPVGSVRELLRQTQTEFWAVNLGAPSAHDPVRETEYLVKGSLTDAEYDGTLRFIASTYRPEDDRLVMGTGPEGPRVITFAPILQGNDFPLNALAIDLLKACEAAVECDVEIEFAMTLDAKQELPARFGFLQVRPMVVSQSRIEVKPEEMAGANLLIASERVLGNGLIDTLVDIVYVQPEGFEAKYTKQIAAELETINREVVASGRLYLLIGFGRWGSSDPWLGIPVDWGQIAGARVIVEATLPDMDVELSQGSHFFHNLTSFQVCYFAVHHAGQYRMNWEWLERQPEIMRTRFVRHVRVDHPLTVKVDGRTGRGVIQI